MAGQNQSPRQKLINMMYLVLTALLALNVSKEILDSFITLDESQQTTRSNTEAELNTMMASFAFNAEGHPDKFEGPYQKAEAIKKQADELVYHINLIKAHCIAETEGVDMDKVYNAELDTVLQVKHIARKDSYVEVTNILYGTSDSPATEPRPKDLTNMRASNLKERLLAFKTHLSQLTPDPSYTASLDDTFNFGPSPDADGELQAWERINFYDVPIAATQTLLSKIQADIRSAELQAVDLLFDEVEGETMKFTRLAEAVVPLTSDVSQGGRFQAEVFLAAYDDSNPPEIRLAAVDAYVNEALEIEGDYELLSIDSNMMGIVDIPATSIGGQHREGLIIFKPAGLPEVRKKFVLDYRVSTPAAIVNPTHMNVMYKGVDNPITVGVPGYRAEDITARIDHGSLHRQSDGSYIARVTSGSSAKVSLSVQLPDGSARALAPVEFRLKSVPSPEAVFAGKTASDSRINKSELTAAQGLRVELKDFLFPVSFRVLSYDIVADINSQPIKQSTRGASLAQDQKTLLREIRSGKSVSIENIFVEAPDGTRRKLASINLRVN